MKNKIKLLNILLIFLLFNFLSYLNSQDIKLKDKYEWLVFVFINGVNDLGILNFSLNDINEMETVGSTDKVAVVVEHNKITRNNDDTLSFSNGANTYFITKDTPNNPDIVSKIIRETPDGNMGSYRHFLISTQYVIKRFNPEKILLVIWNHGNGYLGISYDDISGNNITIPQLATALKEINKTYGKKIDILAMDACLMQMSEIVTELKDYTKYIVASEEIIPGTGYPYEDILTMLNTINSPKEAAIELVKLYHTAYDSSKDSIFGQYLDKKTTLSAIDTDKLKEFINIFNKWLRKAIESTEFPKITDKAITENTFFFSYGERQEVIGAQIINSETENAVTRTADLIDYLKKANEQIEEENLKNETEKLINFITKELIILHKGGNSFNKQRLSYQNNTYGLAIYLPTLRYNSQQYETLQFAKLTLWDEFLKKMLAREKILTRTNLKLPIENKDTESDLSENLKSLKPADIFAEANIYKPTPNSSFVYTSPKALNTTNINAHETINKAPIPANNIQSIQTSLSTTNNLKIIHPKVEISAIAQLPQENRTTITQNIFTASKLTIQNIISTTMEKIKEITETILPNKEKIKNYQEKLKEFEIEISSNINILYAQKLIEDIELQKEFLKIDKNKTLKLISYSNEIIELEKIISKNYLPEEINPLSKTLETILDKSRLICDLKICLPPEKLTEWMEKVKKYALHQISNIELAIRKWEKIFRSNEEEVRWAQAGQVKFTPAVWSNMTIKERNSALDKIIKQTIKSDPLSDIINLSDKRTTQVQKYNELLDAINKISNKMLELGIIDQNFLNSISNKPLSEQMYILSNLFDRGNIKEDPELQPYINLINANRISFTNETLDNKTNIALSSKLTPLLISEINKTEIGKKLSAELKNIKISIEYLESLESKNENGKIIIDARIIEQFLRVKGITTTELLKNKEIQSELALYLSPLIVRETSNIITDKKLISMYAPAVREKLGIGLLYQAKYTQEKMSDEKFKSLFNTFSNLTDYASKTLILKRNYEKSDNPEDFIQSSGIKYYSNLPSANTAKNEILLAINKELERRNSLSKSERETIDKYAIFSLKDIYKFSPFEITNYTKEIKTDALIQLQKELLSSKNFHSELTKIINEAKK